MKKIKNLHYSDNNVMTNAFEKIIENPKVEKSSKLV